MQKVEESFKRKEVEKLLQELSVRREENGEREEEVQKLMATIDSLKKVIRRMASSKKIIEKNNEELLASASEWLEEKDTLLGKIEEHIERETVLAAHFDKLKNEIRIAQKEKRVFEKETNNRKDELIKQNSMIERYVFYTY